MQLDHTAGWLAGKIQDSMQIQILYFVKAIETPNQSSPLTTSVVNDVSEQEI